MHPACRSASRASGFQFFCRGYKNLGGEHHLSANLGDSRSGTDPLQNNDKQSRGTPLFRQDEPPEGLSLWKTNRISRNYSDKRANS
jgi:hypothetical protein